MDTGLAKVCGASTCVSGEEPGPAAVSADELRGRVGGRAAAGHRLLQPGPDGPSPQANCLAQAFRGSDPNGTWKLFAIDDSPGDSGQLARGWSLDITTDIAPPETSISSGPSGTTSNSSASFAFASSEAGSSFECRLDGAAFAPCSSPASFTGLADGAHTFAVRATDQAGNLDATATERAFTVDTTVAGSAAAERTQSQGARIAVKVNVSAGESVTATATGSVVVGKRSFALKPLTKKLAAGSSATLKRRPARAKGNGKIAAALHKRKTLKVVVTGHPHRRCRQQADQEAACEADRLTEPGPLWLRAERSGRP